MTNEIPPLQIPEKKLTFMQKWALKKMLKKSKKIAQQKSKELKKKEENRQKMIQAIKEMLQIFDIQHKNTEITEKHLKTLPYEEILEIFKDGTKALQKII